MQAGSVPQHDFGRHGALTAGPDTTVGFYNGTLPIQLPPMTLRSAPFALAIRF